MQPVLRIVVERQGWKQLEKDAKGWNHGSGRGKGEAFLN